ATDGTGTARRKHFDCAVAAPIMIPPRTTSHRSGGAMDATATLDVGQLAPDFKLRGPGGQSVTLSEYRGAHPVLLVFYPLAFSPVCSHQLPALQKDLARFERLGAVVLG